jgi:hypothetical protein
MLYKVIRLTHYSSVSDLDAYRPKFSLLSHFV